MHPSLFATFSMDLVTISVLFVLLKSKWILEMFNYVLLGNIMPCADHRVGLQIRDVYNFWTSHLCRNLCSCQVPDRRHGWKMLIHITGLQQILPLPCLFLHHPPSCISHRVTQCRWFGPFHIFNHSPLDTPLFSEIGDRKHKLTSAIQFHEVNILKVY